MTAPAPLGLRCVGCGGHTLVVDSRPHRHGIRRNRACEAKCGFANFATLEVPAYPSDTPGGRLETGEDIGRAHVVSQAIELLRGLLS